MLRLAALAVFAAAALAGGCSLTDCSFSAPVRVFATAEARAVPATDTLTVLFVSNTFEDDVALSGRMRPVRTTSADGALRLSLRADLYARREQPQYETAVRGDTVFVRRVRPLAQTVCSPPPAALLYVDQIEAPPGVGTVRVFAGWAEETPFPTAAAPRRAPALVTV